MLDFSSINVIGDNLTEQHCACALNQEISTTRTLTHKKQKICHFWDFSHHGVLLVIGMTWVPEWLVDLVSQPCAKPQFQWMQFQGMHVRWRDEEPRQDPDTLFVTTAHNSEFSQFQLDQC